MRILITLLLFCFCLPALASKELCQAGLSDLRVINYNSEVRGLVEGYSCIDKESEEVVCSARIIHMSSSERIFESFEAWLPNIDSTYEVGVRLFKPIIEPEAHWSKCRIFIDPIFNSCSHTRVTSDKKYLSSEAFVKAWKSESLNFNFSINKSTLTGKFQDINKTSYASQQGFDEMELINCQPLH